MVLRGGVALASDEQLLLFQESLKVLPGDLIDQPFDPAAVLDPLANRFVEGLGNVGADLLLIRTGVEIESRVALSALAAAYDLPHERYRKTKLPRRKGWLARS